MKEIKAYIRRQQLDHVVNALARVEGLTGVSISAVTGFGRSRGRLRFVDFETHIKVEAVCDDALTDSVVDTIQKNACTKQRGDGKIFISDISRGMRIETGIRI